VASRKGTGRLSASARREQISRLTSAQGLVNVEQLAESFDVTPSTIRRDLSLLTGRGELARTYGGAIAIGSEASLRQRTGEFHDAKVAIGSYAATLPKPGETILLDGGSTVLALAGRLRGAAGLHVVTASVPVIDLLDD